MPGGVGGRRARALLLPDLDAVGGIVGLASLDPNLCLWTGKRKIPMSHCLRDAYGYEVHFRMRGHETVSRASLAVAAALRSGHCRDLKGR